MQLQTLYSLCNLGCKVVKLSNIYRNISESVLSKLLSTMHDDDIFNLFSSSSWHETGFPSFASRRSVPGGGTLEEYLCSWQVLIQSASDDSAGVLVFGAPLQVLYLCNNRPSRRSCCCHNSKIDPYQPGSRCLQSL